MNHSNKKAASLLLLALAMGLMSCGANPTSSASKTSSATTSSQASTSQKASSSTTSTVTSTSTKSSTASSNEQSSASSSSSSIDTALAQSRKDALDYLASVDLTLYREKEKGEIQAMITKATAAINDEEATVDSIAATLSAFKSFLAGEKSDAEYTKEEQEAAAKELQDAKDAKIKAIALVDPTQYRSEELTPIQKAHDDLVTAINACSDKAAVEAVSVSGYQALLASSKSSASYVMDELVNYRHASAWSLVNEHAAMWTRSETAVHTNSVGYALAEGNIYGDMDYAFSINADHDVSVAGVMRAVPTTLEGGDGLDGYLINIASKGADQFVQVWYMKNCYASKGSIICDYIGGWVYPGKVLGTTFRISFVGSLVKIYDQAAYDVSGEDTVSTNVDLTASGKYTLVENGYLGYVNWDGTAIDLNLSKVIAPSISGHATANMIATTYVKGVDLTLYRSKEQGEITTKLNAFKQIYEANDSAYSAILAALADFKTFLAGEKTDAEYTKEEDAANLDKVKAAKKATLPSIETGEYSTANATTAQGIIDEMVAAVDACTTVDAVNALDLSSYQTRLDAVESNASAMMKGIITTPTKSDWTLVTEHSASWTNPTSKSIVASTVAWQMDSLTYADFDLVFSIANSADITEEAFIVRGAKSTIGDGFNGYEINLISNSSQKYVQIFYISNAFGTTGTSARDYLGGWVYPSEVKGTTFRASFIGSTCKLYSESDYQSGNTTPAVTVDLTQKTVYTSGAMGVMNWDGGTATYTANKVIIR